MASVLSAWAARRTGRAVCFFSRSISIFVMSQRVDWSRIIVGIFDEEDAGRYSVKQGQSQSASRPRYYLTAPKQPRNRSLTSLFRDETYRRITTRNLSTSSLPSAKSTTRRNIRRGRRRERGCSRCRCSARKLGLSPKGKQKRFIGMVLALFPTWYVWWGRQRGKKGGTWEGLTIHRQPILVPPRRRPKLAQMEQGHTSEIDS